MRWSAATINRDSGLPADAHPGERAALLAVSGESETERLDGNRRAGAEVQDGPELIPAQLHASAVGPAQPAILAPRGEPAVPGDDGEGVEQVRQLFRLLRRRLARKAADHRQLLPVPRLEADLDGTGDCRVQRGVVGLRAVDLPDVTVAGIDDVGSQRQPAAAQHVLAVFAAGGPLRERSAVRQARNHLLEPAQVPAIQRFQRLRQRHAPFVNSASFFSSSWTRFCSRSISAAAGPPRDSTTLFTAVSTLPRSSSTARSPAAITSFTGFAAPSPSLRNMPVTPRIFCSSSSRIVSVLVRSSPSLPARVPAFSA